MSINRGWMWQRFDDEGYIRDEFVKGVNDFLDFAFAQSRLVYRNQIKCPCTKCGNRKFLSRDSVLYHLEKNGFTKGYDLWHAHGESLEKSCDIGGSSTNSNDGRFQYRTMVMDASGLEFDLNARNSEQPPNPEAQKFFDLLKDADEPLWEGCKKHTKLSAMSQLLNVKSEYNMPEACYDRLMSIIKDMLPESEQLPENLYRTKKQLKKLGLGYEKIDCCVNNCILYYKESKHFQECPVCNHPRSNIRIPWRKGMALIDLVILCLIMKHGVR